MKNATIKIELPILNGSLTTATAKCGNTKCRCQRGRKYWHGPYCRWSGTIDGKRTTVTLSQAQAKVVKKAIENYQNLKQQEENLFSESMRQIRDLPVD